MTMTTAERIHFATALVTFHLDNRKKNKKPNPGQILLQNWTSSDPPYCYQGVQLDHHWRQVPPFPAQAGSWRQRFLLGGGPCVVYCGTLCGVFGVLRHCSTATIVPAPPPLHLYRHRLQCGSDRRPTKMLTRALVRASRALPGILTRAQPHMRVPRAGERRSGRLRGRGECARGVQVVAGEEDRWGARVSPVVPPVGISDRGNLLSRREEQGRSMGNFLKLHSQET